jgi:4-amino-4-deoxy-L-arabinose transferase-like glycosyltransferase
VSFKGFTINLSEYLRSGENSVEVKFEDYGGYMGIKLEPMLRDARGIIASLISFLILMFFLFLVSKKIRLPKRYSFILFLAIVIRILYLSVTDYNVRDHDIYAHLEYIKYFVENKSFPPIEKATGGAFFHPPLYYLSAALVYSGTSYLTNNNTDIIHFVLQICSLLASIGFVYFGIKETRLIFAYFSKKDSLLLQRILPWLSCLLIALWPSGVIHSIRISNDSLLYLSFTAAMYGWTCFYLQRKNKHLFMAAFFTAVAILSKLNGAILIPMVVVFFLLKAISGRISFSKRNLIKGFLASLIIIGALGAALYPGLALKHAGKRERVYITYMYGGLVVGNKLENFLWLDLETFVNEPFISPWDDKYGRQYFPNYLGKTALFGEFAYQGVAMHNIAVAISITALIMFVFFIIFLFKIPIKDTGILLPILCISFFLLCGITYMRATFPVNVDFRYILPIIIPFSILYNYGINLLLNEGKQRFAISAMLLELLFCFLSVLFIVELFVYFLESWVIK